MSERKKQETPWGWIYEDLSLRTSASQSTRGEDMDIDEMRSITKSESSSPMADDRRAAPDLQIEIAARANIHLSNIGVEPKIIDSFVHWLEHGNPNSSEQLEELIKNTGGSGTRS